MMNLMKSRILGETTPLIVILHITSRCNLRCGYCFGQYFAQKSNDFTTEELVNLIDDLGKLGTRYINLAGGEPLLRSDLEQLIEQVKKNHSECGINTNGILVPKKIKLLKKVDMICISIDGPKEINDVTRGAGSFEKIMTGIDAALDAGIKVHTNTVLTRYNCNCEAIDWIVNLAKERGFQAEFSLLFNQSERKHNSDRFMAENQVLRKTVNHIAELKAQRAPILFSGAAYRYIANWPDYKQRLIMGQEPDFEYIPCYAGRFMICIDVDGRIYPCAQLIDVFHGLDFREVGLQTAWKNCANHSCKACYFPCFTEFNCIMGLKLEVVFEQIMSTLKGH